MVHRDRGTWSLIAAPVPIIPLRGLIETFTRDDAERLIEKVRGDDPELRDHLRIEERELEARGP